MSIYNIFIHTYKNIVIARGISFSLKNIYIDTEDTCIKPFNLKSYTPINLIENKNTARNTEKYSIINPTL